MHDNACGGNDTLLGAPTGNVITGADTFTFAPDSGNDDISDFRQNDHDKIDVSAYGFDSMAQMMIGGMGADTQIALDANNRVILSASVIPASCRRQTSYLLAKSLTTELIVELSG